MRTDSDVAARAASGSIQQLPQQQQITTLAPAAACTEPAAAAAAAAEVAVPLALQQLPQFALSIVDEFRTELEALRSSMAGSTAEIARPSTAGSEGSGQQQARGNGSSCSNSPASSSGAPPDNAAGSFLQLHPNQSSTQLAAALGDAAAAAAVGAAGSGDLDSSIARAGSKRSLDDADGDQPMKRRASPLQPDGLPPAAAEQLKRPGSLSIERQGSHRPPSALGGRSWADTPPPAEAQEALLQLAAHAENEAASVHTAAGQGPANPSAAAGGVASADVAFQGFQPSDLHTSQVSDLLGAALEAANKCMEDPAPVVQQLLAVLDEHVSLVMAGQHGSKPAAAAGEATAAAVTDAAAGAAAGMMTDDVTGQTAAGEPAATVSLPAAAAAVSGDGSGGQAPLDAAFEAAVAAVQRDCSAMHVDVSGYEQQQQQQRLLTPVQEGLSGVPDSLAAAAADAAVVAAAVTAVESLQDAVMTVAGALGDDVAAAAAVMECSGLPDSAELQYRLGFEHTAAAGCSPGKIPA
jgi:hypothetical protein